jgi:hypothetical protein
MKEIKKSEENSSVIKDYIQGILFLIIPIIIIYIVINYL